MFDMRDKVEFFNENGYVVFSSAISNDFIDKFWLDVENQIDNNLDLTMAKYGKVIKNSEVKGQLLSSDNTVLRIIDLEKHSELSPSMMLAPVVVDFLNLYYQMGPSVLQTLTYKYSSQQGAHSDLHLVNPATTGTKYNRLSLVAAWFACEEANENNGALVIYPKSHLLAKKIFSDFDTYGAYVSYLENLCKEHGIEPKTFEAKKGDVLFWHGDFVHAGGVIKSPGATRRSFVVHYAKILPDDDRYDASLRRYEHNGGYYFK